MAVSLLGCSLLKASFIRSHTHHVAIRPSVDGNGTGRISRERRFLTRRETAKITLTDLSLAIGMPYGAYPRLPTRENAHTRISNFFVF